MKIKDLKIILNGLPEDTDIKIIDYKFYSLRDVRTRTVNNDHLMNIDEWDHLDEDTKINQIEFFTSNVFNNVDHKELSPVILLINAE